MGQFIEEATQIIWPHLPPELISPEAQQLLQNAMMLLAPIRALRAGFECRLGKEYSQVDLQQGFISRDGEPRVLLAHLRHISAEVGEGKATSWQRLQAFCTAWSNPSSSFNAAIDNLWLEYDLPLEKAVSKSPNPSSVAPSVFMGLSKAARSNDQTFSLLDEVIASLAGTKLPLEVADQLRKLGGSRKASGGGTAFTHLGLMLGRTGGGVRLNLKANSLKEAEACLRQANLSPANDQLIEVTARLSPWIENFFCCFDIDAAGNTHNFSLECVPHKSPGNRSWIEFLNELVSYDLCTPEKKQALLGWPRLMTPPTTEQPWPALYIRDSLLHSERYFSAIGLQLNHVKIGYDRQRSHSPKLQAKAYFGVLHRWLGQP